MRKPNWLWIGIMFGVSLFLGYAIFTAAVGAFVPGVNVISKPLLCSGEFSIETTRYSYKPGQVGWQHNIYCDGKDITLAAIATTGFIVSLAIFIVFLIYGRKSIFLPENFGALSNDLESIESSPQGKSPLERMSALKELRDKNLISQVEYERKKDEILKEL